MKVFSIIMSLCATSYALRVSFDAYYSNHAIIVLLWILSALCYALVWVSFNEGE